MMLSASLSFRTAAGVSRVGVSRSAGKTTAGEPMAHSGESPIGLFSGIWGCSLLSVLSLRFPTAADCRAPSSIYLLLSTRSWVPYRIIASRRYYKMNVHIRPSALLAVLLAFTAVNLHDGRRKDTP